MTELADYYCAILQSTDNQGISLLDLILKASPIAKFVLILLLLFSVLSWAIIISKWQALKRSEGATREFLSNFSSQVNFSELYRQAEAQRLSPVARVFLAGYEEITNQLEPPANGLHSLESVNRVLQSATIAEVTQMERSLSWLATAANSSPFIGLFGTVVGIIIAFQGLSSASASSIQSVAPGIAEALIATAAGIGAAVPAAIFYNYFLNKIKINTASLDRFSLELLNRVEHTYRREYGK